jgi:hypothetical protein
MLLVFPASKSRAEQRTCTCLNCVTPNRGTSRNYSIEFFEDENTSDADTIKPPAEDADGENPGDSVSDPDQNAGNDAADPPPDAPDGAQRAHGAKPIMIIFENAAQKSLDSQEIRCLTLYLNTCVPQDNPCTVRVYLPENGTYDVRINHALGCNQTDCIVQGFFLIEEKQTMVAQNNG